eukprot:TRINITY_DN9146_c0_g2_i3.p1 TRINITY_DN9146_c0_g2~~TRINITY_DN9146_c0_g2_i3.p1  ORF type:complete len:254 (-),score=74.75 TRINITY_DN9146_c0_g2_i3:180-941(-)
MCIRDRQSTWAPEEKSSHRKQKTLGAKTMKREVVYDLIELEVFLVLLENIELYLDEITRFDKEMRRTNTSHPAFSTNTTGRNVAKKKELGARPWHDYNQMRPDERVLKLQIAISELLEEAEKMDIEHQPMKKKVLQNRMHFLPVEKYFIRSKHGYIEKDLDHPRFRKDLDWYYPDYMKLRGHDARFLDNYLDDYLQKAWATREHRIVSNLRPMELRETPGIYLEKKPLPSEQKQDELMKKEIERVEKYRMKDR